MKANGGVMNLCKAHGRRSLQRPQQAVSHSCVEEEMVALRYHFVSSSEKEKWHRQSPDNLEETRLATQALGKRTAGHQQDSELKPQDADLKPLRHHMRAELKRFHH